MSTLCALKFRNDVVLATDSLTYDSQSRPISYSQQKIFEIMPGVFYAWSGRVSVALEQVDIARRLARTAQFRTLHDFARALNEASTPVLAHEASRLIAEQYKPAVSGELPFQVYVLAGISLGVPGFLVCEFKIDGDTLRYDLSGSVTSTTVDTPVSYITGDKSLVPLINNPLTWAHGLIAAGERFVDHLRHTTPIVGGPTQMVHVSNTSSRWVHQLADGHGGVALNYGGGVRDDGTGKLTLNPGNGLALSGAQLVQKLSSVGGLAFDGSGNTIANLGYTMQINGSNQIVLSNLPAVHGLPALPSASYPAGAVILNTADNKVYRNPTGTSWVNSSDPADLVAGAVATGVSIAANQISAGSLVAGVIYSGQINASQVNAGTFNGFSLYLSKNGVSMSVDAIYNSAMQGYYGISLYGYESGWNNSGTYFTPHGIYGYNTNMGDPGGGGIETLYLGRSYTLGGGVMILYDAAGTNSIQIQADGIYKNGVKVL